MKTIALFVLVAVLSACQAPAALLRDEASLTPADFVARVEKESASIVDVSASVVRRQPSREPEEQWLHQFFPRLQPFPGSRHELSLQNIGSGFVISRDGLIVTNAHVVADARDVTIRLVGRERPYPARVVGVDRSTDVALLKIDAGELPVASLGRSEWLRVGEWVATIGSPDGFPNTISAGVVSAKGRPLDDTLIPFIQTNVAVSPTSSGGPLLNSKGEVVGISSEVFGRNAGYRDTSFAIPIEVALDVVRQLHVHGTAQRGRLGMRVEDLTPEFANAVNFPHNDGVVVAAVVRDGPAERAGVVAGDIILQLNGARIKSSLDFPRHAVNVKPGTPIKLRLWRHGVVRDVTAVAVALQADRRPSYRS